MKYSVQLSGLKNLEVSDENIMRAVGHAYPCTVCGELTEFVEINYEAPFCSDECLALYDEEMNEACARIATEPDYWSLNETPEEALQALIRTGVCNPDGTPKEQIVTEVHY